MIAILNTLKKVDIDLRHGESPKYFVYVPAARAGLGHFLTATTVYSHYSRLVGRAFYIDTKKWSSFLIQPEEDIDPFFSNYFNEKSFEKSGINLSQKGQKELYEKANKEFWETLVVLPRNTNAEVFMSQGFSKDFRGNLSFIDFRKFRRKYLYKNREHSAKLIIMIVSEPTKGGRWFGKVKSVKSLADFSTQLNEKMNLENLSDYIGIHVRHGNGEYLHGRIEGGDKKFENYVDRIVRTALRHQRKDGSPMIAFSDSVHCLTYLKEKHGILSLDGDDLPDDEWFQHLRSKDAQEKNRVIFKAMKDFYFLSQCKHVVCGSSLFTMAAYLFSKHRSFHLVKPRRIF